MPCMDKYSTMQVNTSITRQNRLDRTGQGDVDAYTFAFLTIYGLFVTLTFWPKKWGDPYIGHTNPLSVVASDGYIWNCSVPSRSNLHFYNFYILISDIRALWRSGLSARVPKCQKLIMYVRPGRQSVSSWHLCPLTKIYEFYEWDGNAVEMQFWKTFSMKLTFEPMTFQT